MRAEPQGQLLSRATSQATSVLEAALQRESVNCARVGEGQRRRRRRRRGRWGRGLRKGGKGEQGEAKGRLGGDWAMAEGRVAETDERKTRGEQDEEDDE